MDVNIKVGPKRVDESKDLQNINERDGSILVHWTAYPGRAHFYTDIQKSTIIQWYNQYCGGGPGPEPPVPGDLGEFKYRIGAISDPHYNINPNDQTEYFNDIVNAMEYFAGLDHMKFVTCCGDMCEEKNKDLVMFTRLWTNKAKVLNGGTPPASLLDFQLILSGTLPLPSMRLLSCLGNHDVKQVDGQTSNRFNDPSTADKWNSIARLLRPDGTTITWEDEVTSDHDDGVTNAPDWLDDAGIPTNRDYGIDALREYIGLTDDDVYFCGYDDVQEPTAGWGTYNRLLAQSGGWNTKGGRSKTNFYVKIKSDGTHAMPYLDNGRYVDDDDFETLFIFLSADYGTDPNVNECWRFDHPYGVLDTTSGYAKDVEDYVLNNEILLGNQNLYNRTNEGLFNYQFYDCKALLWLERVISTYSSKRILIFHHHPFPHKAGNGKSTGGTGYYASKDSIRPYHLTGDGKNSSSSGSYQLCGVQFHFLNILNRKYKNTIWFTGHSHLIWEDEQYDSYLNFCNKEFDYKIPTAAEAATDYNGSSNVPAFYTRTSETSTEETGWNVHLPSLSRPKTLANGTEQKLPYASEGAVIDIHEHGVLIKPIIFKENSSGQGGTYVNRLYGDGQVILDTKEADIVTTDLGVDNDTYIYAHFNCNGSLPVNSKIRFDLFDGTSIWCYSGDWSEYNPISGGEAFDAYQNKYHAPTGQGSFIFFDDNGIPPELKYLWWESVAAGGTTSLAGKVTFSPAYSFYVVKGQYFNNPSTRYLSPTDSEYGGTGTEKQVLIDGFNNVIEKRGYRIVSVTVYYFDGQIEKSYNSVLRGVYKTTDAGDTIIGGNLGNYWRNGNGIEGSDYGLLFDIDISL